ncbi:hypothetical protein [Cupriavidus sp. CuC1]|uniref:hypothetical protein n=1 Tax=Cupriavidus sp. CuC1 TaxID=3373131 RepID=UPI0037D4A55C
MPDQFDAAAAVDGFLADQTASQLKTSMALSAQEKPDFVAESRRLSQTLGLPPQTVASDIESAKQRATVETFDAAAYARDFPQAAKFMADPQNAAVAHDDTQNLGALDSTLSAIGAAARYMVSADDKGGLLRDIWAGVHGANRGAAGVFQAGAELAAPLLDPLAGTILPENPLRRAAASFAGMGAYSGQSMKELSPPSNSVIGGGVSSGVQSLTQNMLTLPLAFFPGGQAAALAGMAGGQGGQSYQDAREKGLPMQTALPFAASQAAIEYATEKIPMQRLLGDLASNATLRQTLVHQIASEVPGEQIATVLQDANEWAILHPEKSFKDYLADRPAAAAQTLIATVIGVGGNVAVMRTIDGVVNADAKQQQAAQQAERSAQALSALDQLAAASKLRERAPDTFEQFVAQATQDGPVPDVYIDAKVLAQSGVAEQVAAVSPAVAEQFQTALDTGSDIRIPVADFATNIAGTEYAQGLLDHLKTDPNGMSRVEAQEYMQSHAEQLQQDVEKALAEKQGDDTFKASAEAVKAEVRSQLEQAGRFTAPVNDAYASMVGNFYAVMAARLGLTPQDMFARYPLQVAAQRIAGGQQLDQGQRGAFNPATNTITLLKNADLSTFLHETGHFSLEVLTDLAARQDTPQPVRDDAAALMKWFGLRDLDEWHALDFEEKRSHHEQFARGFEAYLFEGKAPSIEMQGLFQRFRAWLLNVYKELKALNVELTDEVRGVMDRMLASTEEIKLAEQGRSMMPLFTSPDQVGMTPEEFAAYQALGVDATNDAIQDLQARGLRDMQWIHNARGREIARLKKESAARRAEVQMDVRREVMSQPVYRAWQFLTEKPKKVAGEQTPEQAAHKSAMVEWEKQRTEAGDVAREKAKRDAWENAAESKADYPNGQARGMAKGQFLARMKKDIDLTVARALLDWERANLKPERPATQVEESPDAQHYGKLDLDAVRSLGIPAEITDHIKTLRMTGKEGLHPDVVAELFGFTSGDELVRTLAAAPTPKDEINALTDVRMLEQYGDLADAQAIERAADRAIHNDARARLVATEANALAKATGKPKLLATAAREYARAIIDRLKLRDIRPGQYAAAEARAAKASDKAMSAKDLDTAAAEKRNQLVNNYAARAAYAAQEEVEKGLRYLKKFDSEGVRKSLDADYIEQIDALRDRYDLRQQSNKAADRGVSLRTWVQSRLNAGEIPDIAESLLSPRERAAYLAETQSRDEDGDLVYADDEDRLKLLAEAIDRSAKRPYKDLTVEEFRGLVETIKNVEHLGRLKHTLLTARDNQTYEAVRDEIAAGINADAKKGGKNTRTANDWLGQKLQAIKQFGAAHIKVATWAQIMDGGKDNGPVWRYIVRPANERASRETTMRADATAALDAILRPVLAKVAATDKLGKGKFFPTIGDSLNWQERFAIALNVGNESNMQRLLGGKGWTMGQIKPVLDTLTTAEWQAAQAIWDHFESYRPQIAEKEKRVSGKEPEWIRARPISVQTADGQVLTLRGGYYPVVFDPRVNMKASQHSAAEEAKNLLKSAYSAATTRRSFTKSRVDEVSGRPLLLNLQGLYSGVNDVIHDLAWHEWVIDANRLLRSKSIDSAIREHYGPEVKREFEKWRDDIVAGTRRLDHAIERAAGWARQSVSASALTFNVVSAAMQPLGLSNSIVRIGATWVGKGLARYVASPIESTREAQAKSEWLTNRTRTRFRELNELRNQVQGQTAAKELLGRYGYWMMMRAQMMVDVPTWWGGYEKAIAEGHNEDTAIALADQAVKDSQGGGEEVDQSGVERGGPLVKLFTAFYGFMGTTLNTGYRDAKTEASKAKIGVNMLLLYSVPAVLGAILKDALTPGGGGDDPEKLAKKLIAEQLSFLMGMVAFGREFDQAGKALLGEDKGRGYSGPAGLRVVVDSYKMAQQTHQGEFDDGFRKAFVNLLGDLAGLPAVQINRTITGAQALSEGKTANPAALVFGFQK